MNVPGKAPFQSGKRDTVLVRADDEPRRADGERDWYSDKRPRSLQPREIAVHQIERDQRRENEDRNEQRVDQNAEANRDPEKQCR
jgi:hypothetical protein